MTKMIKFSRFMHTKEKDGIVAIFNSLNPKPIFIDKQTWNNFLERKEEQNIVNLLSSLKLIIDSEEDDNATMKNIQINYELTSKQVSILYLVVTHRCNLRCKYCFEVSFDSEKSRGKMMTSKTAKAGIDLFANQLKMSSLSSQHCLIILYGGEPLLNKNICFYSVEYVRLLQEQEILPKRTEIVIITNGSLIDKKIAAFFKKNNVSTIVSIDSPKEKINDQCRIDKNNKGTFKKAIKAIEILKKANSDLGVSITITPYNVDELDAIPKWLSKLGIKNYGLNRLVGNTYDSIGTEVLEEEYSRKASKQIVNCFINARELGIYEDRMGRKLNSFISKEFYSTDCGAYGEQLVVQPNGDISICHADWKYNVGHIEGLNCSPVWDSELVKKWKKRLPLYKKECLNCEAIGICGGGCAYSAKQYKGTVCSLDTEFCRHTKESFNFLVWDLYKQSKHADK